MINIPIFPLQSYKVKIVGLIVSMLAAILMAVFKSFKNLILINSLDNSQHFQLFIWLSISGLFLIAYSKEKNEDARVKIIRSKSLQIAFGFLVSTLLAVNLVGIISSSFSINVSQDMSLIAAVGILTYLLCFYIAIYFDPNWTYNDDSVLASFKKNNFFF